MSGKSEDNAVELTEDKRIPKCSGCKAPHDIHLWASPGPYCKGKPETVYKPSDLAVDQEVIESGVEERNDEEDEEDETFLLERLKALQVAEQVLAKKQRVAKLKRAIADAEERLSFLQKPPASLPPSASAVSSAMLGNVEPANMTSAGLPRTPLDDLLAGEQSSSLKVPNLDQDSAIASMNSVFSLSVAASHGGQAPDGPLAAPHTVQESLMFLKPV